MAFTIDSNTLRSTGNAFRVSGTYESATASTTQEDIFPNGYILSFSVDGNDDDHDTAIGQVRVNTSNFSGAVDNGSICHKEETASQTIRWTADFIM
jgi:hypothetical protein